MNSVCLPLIWKLNIIFSSFDAVDCVIEFKVSSNTECYVEKIWIYFQQSDLLATSNLQVLFKFTSRFKTFAYLCHNFCVFL